MIVPLTVEVSVALSTATETASPAIPSRNRIASAPAEVSDSPFALTKTLPSVDSILEAALVDTVDSALFNERAKAIARSTQNPIDSQRW